MAFDGNENKQGGLSPRLTQSTTAATVLRMIVHFIKREKVLVSLLYKACFCIMIAHSTNIVSLIQIKSNKSPISTYIL